MATLNVKNFPDELYERVRALAARDRRSVSQHVIRLLEAATHDEKLHSVLELKGLGKELWRGVDAAEHVRRERDTWD